MDKSFEDIEIYDGLVERPKPEGSMSMVPRSSSAMVSAEQSRSIAEVQAALVVARMNPRDENVAYIRILEECRRPAFAKGQNALYSYKRGTTKIQDINIRVAEMMARCWTNINYGMRELSRHNGISEVETFAWDLESNVKVTRQFQVRHVRDKSEGGNVELTQERDIYELMANMGQRRVRACILEHIPSYIKDKAKETLLVTQTGGQKQSFNDWLKALLDNFNQNGITKKMIDQRLGHDCGECSREEGVELNQILTLIADNKAKREDFFQVVSKPEEPSPTSSQPAKRGRQPKQQPEAPPPELEMPEFSGNMDAQEQDTTVCPYTKDPVDAEMCATCQVKDNCEQAMQ